MRLKFSSGEFALRPFKNIKALSIDSFLAMISAAISFDSIK